jgi:hypothetical protein
MIWLKLIFMDAFIVDQSWLNNSASFCFLFLQEQDMKKGKKRILHWRHARRIPGYTDLPFHLNNTKKNEKLQNKQLQLMN